MEISKKTILSILNEVDSTEIDELAYKRKETQAQRVDPNTGQVKPPKFKPYFKEGNNTEIPDYWVVNVRQIVGEEQLFVPLGCDEMTSFMRENEDWLSSIGALHGLEPQVISCTRGKYHRPIEKAVASGYVPTGEHYSLRENLQRKFKAVMRNEFSDRSPEGREFNEELEKRSIPPIPFTPEYLDTHGDTWTNEKIVFRTHNYNSYESAEDFLIAVIGRIDGEEVPEYRTHHLARQFNLKYQNWNEAKKSEKEYAGETPKYKLEKFGYAEPNLDVSMKMEFEIVGEMMGNSFIWKIDMKNKFGRKSPDEYSIKRGLNDVTLKTNGFLDDQPLTITKSFQLSPGKEFDDRNTILDDFEIKQGLLETIEDFKNLVKNTDPNSALEIANVSKRDVGNISENELNKIVGKILKEIKK